MSDLYGRPRPKPADGAARASILNSTTARPVVAQVPRPSLCFHAPRPVLEHVAKPSAILPKDTGNVRPWTPPTVGAAKEVSAPEQVHPATPAVDHEAVRAEAFAAECDRIRAQAREEGFKEGLDSGRAEGYEQGFAKGEKAGFDQSLEQGAAEQAAITSNMGHSLETLTQDIERLKEEIGQAAVHMGVRIARHVVMREVQEPAGLLPLIKNVLAQSHHHSGLIILRLNPTDAELISQDVMASKGKADLSIDVDPDLERGDLRVKTAWGDIDATWQTRLDNAFAALGYAGSTAQAQVKK